MDEDIVLLTDKDRTGGWYEEDHEACAAFCAGEILPAMNDLRVVTDRLESMVDSRFWPSHLQRNPLQRLGRNPGIW